MKKERESGIELYKVIAIFLIVLSHVIQTLTEPNYVLGIGEGTFINIATATTDLNVLLLALFRICGVLGNNMFFICSAWFLVNSNALFKELVDSPQKRTEKTEEVSMIFL